MSYNFMRTENKNFTGTNIYYIYSAHHGGIHVINITNIISFLVTHTKNKFWDRYIYFFSI